GALRSRGHAARRGGPRATRPRAARPECPSGPDHRRPRQLLAHDVSRGPEGAARAVPEARLARRSFGRRAAPAPLRAACSAAPRIPGMAVAPPRPPYWLTRLLLLRLFTRGCFVCVL